MYIPLSNSYLVETVETLIQKHAIEKHNTQTSGFLSPTFLGPKAQQLAETCNRSRTSRMSISTYLHTHRPGNKYVFMSNVKPTYSKLLFRLSTAPMDFTVVVKNFKLMAPSRGKRIQQYLNNWSVRARVHHTSLWDTQNHMALCQKVCCIVNVEKSEYKPKQVYDIA